MRNDLNLKKEFYKEKWFMWVMLIVFAPVGIILMFKYNNSLPGKTKKILSIVFAIFFLFVLVSGSQNNTTLLSDDSNSSNSNENNKVKDKIVTIDELTEKNMATMGEIDSIYRMNTKKTNLDGSYIFINVQSINYYDNYAVNNGTIISNVIVIENVLPLEETQNLVKKAAYFQTFDEYGNELYTGDIYTQTGTQFSEIIFSTQDESKTKKVKYVLIGGLDSATNQKSKIIFKIEKK